MFDTPEIMGCPHDVAICVLPRDEDVVSNNYQGHSCRLPASGLTVQPMRLRKHQPRSMLIMLVSKSHALVRCTLCCFLCLSVFPVPAAPGCISLNAVTSNLGEEQEAASSDLRACITGRHRAVKG